MFENMNIAVIMVLILGGMIFLLYLLTFVQTLDPSGGNWLPIKIEQNSKKEFEIYSLYYTIIWILVFAIIILLQLYEQFDEYSYLALGLSLAAPFLLQPIIFPLANERKLPLFERYSFKANVWIAIYSYIGNYWYTHYFYSVLQARYTFPSWRLNDVPIALYFCTHFYFVSYHTASNLILRKIETRYRSSGMRTILFWATVVSFSYFTAFMETLTISSFPYYSFQDRFMAYTLGSAFYGIYFLVSFPMFYRLDETKVNDNSSTSKKFAPPHTLYQTVAEAFGACMIILSLLDLCRLYFGIELNISGKFFYLYKP